MIEVKYKNTKEQYLHCIEENYNLKVSKSNRRLYKIILAKNCISICVYITGIVLISNIFEDAAVLLSLLYIFFILFFFLYYGRNPLDNKQLYKVFSKQIDNEMYILNQEIVVTLYDNEIHITRGEIKSIVDIKSITKMKCFKDYYYISYPNHI